MNYSPQGHKESDTTEVTSHAHIIYIHTHTHTEERECEKAQSHEMLTFENSGLKVYEILRTSL